MNTLLYRLSAAIFAATLFAIAAHAQDATNQATIKFPDRQVTFKRVAAVRGKSSGEARISVIATSQPLPATALQKVKDKDAEDNLDRELDQPYLNAVFQEDGTLRCLIGRAGNNSFMDRRSPLEGQATIADGRIRGSRATSAPPKPTKASDLEGQVNNTISTVRLRDRRARHARRRGTLAPCRTDSGRGRPYSLASQRASGSSTVAFV